VTLSDYITLGRRQWNAAEVSYDTPGAEALPEKTKAAQH